MAQAVISVVAGSVVQDNTQRYQVFDGKLAVTGRLDDYVGGGLPLDSVLAAALLPNSNQAPVRVDIMSEAGSGYIYQRIAATGKMMILQVPVNGSLTTAAPLNELPNRNTDGSAGTLSKVFADTIRFKAYYNRNT
jgi:hypothetical protein